MKKMPKKDQLEVQQWLHRNARELEVALWNCHFEAGSKEAVIEALRFYRNEDGGFGNGLEQDSWNPESSPYTTLHAGNILKSVMGGEAASEVLRSILTYFDQTPHYSQTKGWDFSIPSNNDYPHAIWWTFNEEMNQHENPGLTADISAFILKFASREQKIYQKALYHAEILIAEFLTKESFGEMEIMGIYRLTKLAAAHLSSSSELLENVHKKLIIVVNNTIEKDTDKWKEYHPRPSVFISSTEDDFYADNKKLLEIELDYLIDVREKAGVWDIPWNWMQEDEVSQKAFIMIQNSIKGSLAIQQMRMLRTFGRLETE